MRHTFRFYKTLSNRWYIDLPGWEGGIGELEMVEGADTMLDKISGDGNECFIDMSDEPFEGSDTVKLVSDLRDSIGGGNYIMETYKGEPVNHPMWLCAVTEHVFADLPEAIYVSPVTNNG
ncbi:DUF6717 family protein [Chitinophaga sp. CF418]|uniref:DUF6717 family protein n=1 Tax=Chitinophaga sp. CF418 TaxID=1855287 RepID=UPI00091AFDF0|nr:DUF6717 family protein [Chitinophaga sp. CF418]SHM86111.1 hypothetical protein SAMN05216311_103495 [Chitinophaga sp. CF418]